MHFFRKCPMFRWSIPLTVVRTNESKEKKYEELWIKIRYLIRSITKNLNDYDEKYLEIKFN